MIKQTFVTGMSIWTFVTGMSLWTFVSHVYMKIWSKIDCLWKCEYKKALFKYFDTKYKWYSKLKIWKKCKLKFIPVLICLLGLFDIYNKCIQYIHNTEMQNQKYVNLLYY